MNYLLKSSPCLTCSAASCADRAAIVAGLRDENCQFATPHTGVEGDLGCLCSLHPFPTSLKASQWSWVGGPNMQYGVMAVREAEAHMPCRTYLVLYSRMLYYHTRGTRHTCTRHIGCVTRNPRDETSFWSRANQRPGGECPFCGLSRMLS